VRCSFFLAATRLRSRVLLVAEFVVF